MFVFSIISLLFLSAYALLIGYYHRAWNSIPLIPTRELSEPLSPVRISVIIPARNEAQNIARCLDSLSRQTYPGDQYEVIVVDDHSTDNTWELLLALQYENMSLLRLRLSDYTKGLPEKAYKKFAIETAIEKARGPFILTTDADCAFHPEWLNAMAAFYSHHGAKFIAAPVKINAGHSLLSIFQTLDFITLQGITGASVYKSVHSMCNGANLGYEKQAFKEVGGFSGIDHIPSGDDMLLMFKIFKKYPDKVFFLKEKNAIVSTEPETSWKGFFNQRIRWASKADQYEDKRIFWVLLFVYLFNLLFLVSGLLGFINIRFLELVCFLLVLKTLIEYPFVRSVARFFDQQSLMVYFPFFQPIHILYTIIIGWLGKFGTYQWKGRKI